MTSTTASPDLQAPSNAALPADIVAGGVVVALAAAAGTDASPAPAWIKIAPRGRITTRDQRSYAFDPETLAARFSADGVKIPIDFEHATGRLAAQGHRADAIGWIDQMEARADGLYGRVDWLDEGRAALAARTHRYLSPAFPHDASGNAKWIHHVALVTAPALAGMPALAQAGPATDTTNPETLMTKKIAAALGLADSADETALLSAIADLKGGKVDAAVHNETLATLSATKQELDEIKAAGRKAKVDALIEGALKDKRIVPAQRDHYATLCATDEGLAQVTALLAATPKCLGASGLDGKAADIGEAAAIDPAMLAAEARAYQSAQAASGNPISYLDAFAHAQEQHGKKGTAA